ncbi:ParB/RepB/Spo0J family partition protein [Alkaliphilus hydrothermalis]|uniref:ParB family chromosome partitioning protein n=1 Tax=Alkaliphilus hydrothermalis TaxID=1482730 RepID=A0ABS2NRL7_9FIRM|nr:ParB/RepB/Spo0J family partition protein [Alkaliphilus hydrothermalis]MBM7615580.1 ParB family chromosome partitioning protein [Alkaliphilus hydrothermalis]
MTKAKKRGLGKGLEALIPQTNTVHIEEDSIVEGKVHNININKVYPNVNQPRKDFQQEQILELAQSIKNHGFIQPIIVMKEEKGYMIIAGERRWRAAKELQLQEIPCIVKQYEDHRILEIALVENLQREDLNVIEEALAYQQILKDYSITQEQLSEAIGKSRPYIANSIRLLNLDERVIEMIRLGQISSGHGRVLLRLDNLENQYKVAQQILEHQLNVRQLEELIEPKNTSNKKEKTSKSKDYILLEIEDSLKKRFGTKVTINKGPKKGKIEIEYYNEDDLERIVELLERA